MIEFTDLIKDYVREKQEKKGHDVCVASWLDSASKRASQISIATHVLKFSNSEAKGTNVYIKDELNNDSISKSYVSTRCLDRVRDDFVGNAAALDVAGLLRLEVDGITLLNLIEKDDSSPFASFASSESQMYSWMTGFKSVLVDKNITSHSLAKQIYFPVEDDKYHLLAPLYPSSLCQALYDRIKEDRFGEKAKVARDLRKKRQFSDEFIIDYPDLAIQMFGGTKPQNISLLNSFRGGKSFLLRSVSPIWKHFKKPPIKKNEFWKIYSRKSDITLKEFKDLLHRIKNLDSNKELRDQTHFYIQQMLDLLVQTAAEVKLIPPGWSKDSEIPLHEQLWLDPLRADQDFQTLRQTQDWKESISKRFENWLINKLQDKNLKFSDTYHIYFRDECLEILKAVES